MVSFGSFDIDLFRLISSRCVLKSSVGIIAAVSLGSFDFIDIRSLKLSHF